MSKPTVKHHKVGTRSLVTITGPVETDPAKMKALLERFSSAEWWVLRRYRALDEIAQAVQNAIAQGADYAPDVLRDDRLAAERRAWQEHVCTLAAICTEIHEAIDNEEVECAVGLAIELGILRERCITLLDRGTVGAVRRDRGAAQGTASTSDKARARRQTLESEVAEVRSPGFISITEACEIVGRRQTPRIKGDTVYRLLRSSQK